MPTAFVKMHGAGNDFVVFDERAHPLALTPALIAAIANRHTGIGCDQVIRLRPPEADATAAATFMQIHNADGSEVGACGNATRCVADLLFRESGGRRQTLQTRAGLLSAEVLADGRVQVDMGEARLGWRDLPLAREMDTLHLDLPGDPAGAAIGNPHATFFVPDLEQVPVERLGPRFEQDPLFPERANIGFVQVLAPERLRLRVWERGVGITLACGTAACAAVVNAARRSLACRAAEVIVDGGVLDIAWREDGHVLMTGPVAMAFRGEIDLGRLA